MNAKQVQAWATKLGKKPRQIEYLSEVFGEAQAEKIFETMARTDKATKELRALTKADVGPTANTGHRAEGNIDAFWNLPIQKKEAALAPPTTFSRFWGMQVPVVFSKQRKTVRDLFWGTEVEVK